MYKKYLYKFLLVMRLTTVILIATMMQVSANSFAQRLTYTKNNATLAEIFKEIRKQTGYNVLWSAKKVNQSVKIHVSFSNTPLKAVLDKALADQKLTYEIDDKNIIIKEKEPSLLDRTRVVIQSAAKDLLQDLNVRGVVVDENGSPLEGATVVLKGSNRTAKTDVKGEFVLANVPDDGVLVIRYVGYKQLEIGLKDAMMPLEIKLNVATGELEEVKVVYNTGYQELNKERSTGSFVQIDNELFNRAVGTNVLDRILNVTSGLISLPGLNLGGINTRGITIRGFSTINANMQALIVVDNFPYEGDLNNLNPNDCWASWCSPCRAEIPRLKNLYTPYKLRGFNIIGISSDTNKLAWIKAIKEDQTQWQQSIDNDKTVAKLFDIGSIPTYILIDSKGKLIAFDASMSSIQRFGGSLRGEALDKKLEELLGPIK